MNSTVAIPRFALVVLLAALLPACGGKEEHQMPKTIAFVPPASVPAFDGGRAFALLERQVDFGPRMPNSEAHESCLAFFGKFFDSLGVATEMQTFRLAGYDGTQLRLTNVIARLRPEAKDRILLAAHWDSRPFADRETDPVLAAQPIPGANDGASGVAVLLHLAEILSAHPAAVGVDIVLFDGEDYGREGDESMFLIGSKYFAATLGDATRYRFGILLDLVGDRDAVFPREALSKQYAGDVQDMIWTEARRLGLTAFSDRAHSAILDDHVPLNTVAGIKTVDIIDAELVGGDTADPRRGYWHTLRDTPEQCDAQTLAAIGRLLLSIIHGLQPA